MGDINHYPWFNAYNAFKSTFLRLKTPIHHHLKQFDFVAAQAQLWSGADPAIVDECGRTALDYAIQMSIEYVEMMLCTFPIYFLNDYLSSQSLKFFNISRHKKFCCGDSLYHNPKALCRFPRYSYECQQTNYDVDYLKNIRKKENNSFLCFPLPEANEINKGNILQKLDSSKLYNTDCLNHGISTENQLMQRNVLIAVEHIFKNFSAKHMNKIKEILCRLKATNKFIKLLVECAYLRQKAKETTYFVMQLISYPFFYCALMHTSFHAYPLHPSGRFWDTKNLEDARILVNLIINKQLPGKELFKFIGAAPKHVIDLVNIFGAKILQHLKPEEAQYWLHLSFVLDVPDLFEAVASAQPNIFYPGHFFKWNNLLHTLTQNKKLPRFTRILLSIRLKNLTKQRLMFRTK